MLAKASPLALLRSLRSRCTCNAIQSAAVAVALDARLSFLPCTQIWVYGNSFESSLVAVVVPLHGKLQASCGGCGWAWEMGTWAAAAAELPVCAAPASSPLLSSPQLLRGWCAPPLTRPACSPCTPQSLGEEVGVSGTDEQLCHNPKARIDPGLCGASSHAQWRRVGGWTLDGQLGNCPPLLHCLVHPTQPHATALLPASLLQVVEALLASLTATGKEGKLKVSRAALTCAGVSTGVSVATVWLETHSCQAAALGHQSKRPRRCDLPPALQARAPDRLQHSQNPDPPLPSTCLAGL